MPRGLRRIALWLLDRAGPEDRRQSRREWAVAAKSDVVRRLRRLILRQRRLRGTRLDLIRTIELASAGDALSSADDPGDRDPSALSGARIGVYIPGFLSGFGGAEKVAGQVAGLLVRLGAEVDLICIRPEQQVRPYELAAGVALRVLERYGAEASLQSRYQLIIAFGMPGFYRRIPDVAISLGAPFVIQECTNPDAMTAALRASLSLETDHEARWLRQAVLAHAVAARFTTPEYAKTVHPQIAPFAHGFYNAFSRSSAPSSATRSPRKKLICVGALKNRNKNGLAAAEAFATFASGIPGWSLHFYGENNFSDALRRFAQEHPVVSIVDEGIEKNIDLIYGDAHALVIPSFEEGLPNVVVEAFTYGVPCIGFDDCSGVRHLITHEKTGLLADRSQPGSLAAAMTQLAEPSLRQRMSGEALAFAETELGVAAWEDRWLRLVSQALAGVDRQGHPRRPAAIDPCSASATAWRQLLASFPAAG